MKIALFATILMFSVSALSDEKNSLNSEKACNVQLNLFHDVDGKTIVEKKSLQILTNEETLIVRENDQVLALSGNEYEESQIQNIDFENVYMLKGELSVPESFIHEAFIIDENNNNETNLFANLNSSGLRLENSKSAETYTAVIDNLNIGIALTHVAGKDNQSMGKFVSTSQGDVQPCK